MIEIVRRSIDGTVTQEFISVTTKTFLAMDERTFSREDEPLHPTKAVLRCDETLYGFDIEVVIVAYHPPPEPVDPDEHEEARALLRRHREMRERLEARFIKRSNRGQRAKAGLRVDTRKSHRRFGRDTTRHEAA